MQKLKERFKKLKGGLAQQITAVFLIIVSVLVFYSAIHPTGATVKDQGQDAGMSITTESEAMKSEFTPISFGE